MTHGKKSEKYTQNICKNNRVGNTFLCCCKQNFLIVILPHHSNEFTFYRAKKNHEKTAAYILNESYKNEQK